MKLTYILSAFALTLSLYSCNEQPKETTTIIEKTVEPRTVVVEKEVRVVEKEVVVEKETKGTTIELGPNGGSFKTTK